MAYYTPPRHPLFEAVRPASPGGAIRWLGGLYGQVDAPASSVLLGLRQIDIKGVVVVSSTNRSFDPGLEDMRRAAALVLHHITRPDDVGLERHEPSSTFAEMDRIVQSDQDWQEDTRGEPVDPVLSEPSWSWHEGSRSIRILPGPDVVVTLVGRGLAVADLAIRRVSSWDAYGIDLGRPWSADELTTYRTPRPVEEFELAD